MKSFDSLKIYLAWEVFSVSDQRKSHGTFLKCIQFGCLVTFVHTTIWYFVTADQTFYEYTYNFYYVSFSLLIFAWYIIFQWNRSKYMALRRSLDGIRQNESQQGTNQSVYESSDVSVENVLGKIHIIMMYFVTPIYTSTPIILSLLRIVSSGLTSESFQQVFPASLPFDWRTPIGYLACISIQISILYLLADMCTFIAVFTSIFCIFVTDFVSVIEEELRGLDKILLDKDSTMTIINKRLEIAKKLGDLIRFHSQTREFTISFSDTNSGIVLAFLVYIGTSSCSSFLQMNALLVYGNIPIRPTISILLLLSTLYMFCYIGDRVTQRFEDVGDSIYLFDWQLLPLNAQKSIPLMIALAQKKIFIRGMGNAHYTREVFKKILKTTFSYFMILRDFVF